MKNLKPKDPGSAITHLIGWLMAIFAATPLLIRAAKAPDSIHVICLTVFILSMIFLYGASTIYHTLDISPGINKILKKIDHMMIFILIAGTYTPEIRGRNGLQFLFPSRGDKEEGQGTDIPAKTVYCIPGGFHPVHLLYQKRFRFRDPQLCGRQ